VNDVTGWIKRWIERAVSRSLVILQWRCSKGLILEECTVLIEGGRRPPR
jgi:hypothetical protein